MAFDLKDMSRKDLERLRADVDKALANYDKVRRQEALRAAEQIAKEKGFTLDELLGDKPKGRRTVSAPKYAHPENPELTWTGRGRRPAWLQERLDQGESMEAFLIEKRNG